MIDQEKVYFLLSLSSWDYPFKTVLLDKKFGEVLNIQTKLRYKNWPGIQSHNQIYSTEIAQEYS